MKNGDFICQVLRHQGQSAPEAAVIAGLVRVGSVRPDISIRQSLKFKYLLRYFVNGIPFLRCERNPIPIP